MLWRFVGGVYDACWRRRFALHVEHKGAYSLERLQVLHHFLEQQNADTLSVILDLLVAVATPLPCLAIALISDAMPLAPPEDGPRANGMFWARTWLIMSSFTLAVLLPMHHPSVAPIPERRGLLYLLSAVISAVYTGFYFAVASVLGFPVPFSYLTLNMVWISLIVAGFWAYMGPACRASGLVRQRLKLHAIFIYAASSLAVVYPLFYYAFLCAREYASAQLLLTFALPVIKVMEKLLLYHTTCHAPDVQPVFIVFNVEVFNALFVSSCMRNATSISVTIALMVADFVGACAALYGLRNAMLHIDSLSAKIGTDATRAQMVGTAALIVLHHHPDTLVSELIVHELEQNKGRNAVAVLPWVSGDLSSRDEHDRNVSNNDAKQNGVACSEEVINPPTSPSKLEMMFFKQSTVLPTEISSLSPFHRGPSVANMQRTTLPFRLMEQLSLQEQQQYVHEACRVLRRVEFLLLVEYTEVMIPIVYVVYISTVYYLPNRKYFPYLNEMSETDLANTVRSVLIYESLQLLSFVLLLVVLSRRFQLAPGKILRFVLHNEWRVVQGHFVLWIIYVLQSSIQHVGTDYTFKFRWLHK